MRSLGILVLAAAVWAAPMHPSTACAQNQPPVIPRSVLFGNPDRAGVRLSPDGTAISFLSNDNGVLNVWVGPSDHPDAARAVTHETKRGIRRYFWAFNNRNILYRMDKDGNENYHIMSVDLVTGTTTDLTPIDGVRAEVQQMSREFPDQILVGLNNRDPRLHDIYRVNIRTGERGLVQQNDGGFLGFVTDDDFDVRFAQRFTPDGGTELLSPDGKGGWTTFMKIPMADSLTTNPIGFNKDGDVMYMLDSRGRDTAALATLNIKTGEEKIVASSDKADVGGVMVDPVEKTLQAYSVDYLRNKWTAIGDAIKPDLEYLRTVEPGDITVTSRTTDDKHWLVAYINDDGPVRYYMYHRPQHKADFLFTNSKELAGYSLTKMHPLVIKSEDGLDLVSYLSLPPWTDTDGDARPDHPVPMVLLVHGGPWARDTWGYNPIHQWLANRGYAVLSVNFRGSTGFGKAFLNAGNMEWAGKMQRDLTDGVHWAQTEHVAEPSKVGIMGGSYGGYATLVGLTFTPDEYACGVDIAGPTNLVSLIRNIPPYWAPAIEQFTRRVGNPSTPEGAKELESRSPLTFADKIDKPLLIGQGANDPRVKQSEPDQIVHMMQSKHIPVTYVLYPDEGHGFERPANRMSFNAIAEAFLSEHLGGRYEPIGDAFKGSSVTVPVGADLVPGLDSALKAHEP